MAGKKRNILKVFHFAAQRGRDESATKLQNERRRVYICSPCLEEGIGQKYRILIGDENQHLHIYNSNS